MNRIRAGIADARPEAAALIAPLRVFDLNEIAPMPEITHRWQALRRVAPLGEQYDILARLARQEGLAGLEMAIHRDDRAHAHLCEAVVRDGDAYVLSSAARPELELFRNFRFPLFDVTKRDMQAAARRHGFLHLMELTWFCHAPDRHARPCGACNPCRFAIEEGMGRRIPWPGRIRYYIRRNVGAAVDCVPWRIRLPARRLLRAVRG